MYVVAANLNLYSSTIAFNQVGVGGYLGAGFVASGGDANLYGSIIAGTPRPKTSGIFGLASGQSRAPTTS